MIRDHEYTILVAGMGNGKQLRYLTCDKCGNMFRIKGNTRKKRNTHMLTLLQSFKWEPCVGRIEGAVRKGITRGGGRSSSSYYGTPKIQAVSNKVLDIQKSFDATKEFFNQKT